MADSMSLASLPFTLRGWRTGVGAVVLLVGCQTTIPSRLVGDGSSKVSIAPPQTMVRGHGEFAGNSREVPPSTLDASREGITQATAVSPSVSGVRASAPELAATASGGLSLGALVHMGLESNPALTVIRQQRGIAEAGIVIARTYPFNPVASAQLLDVHGGTAAAPVTNPMQYQTAVTLAVEIRGQRYFRKQAAFAALTRTDWEIAFQEVTFAVNTVRAFDTLLYRQAKLALTEEFLRLNQEAAADVKRLMDGGSLRPADLILSRAEVADIQSQLGLGRTALITARRDLARAVGMAEVGDFPLSGTMDRPVAAADTAELLESAFEHRPDLFAQRAAVAEADARLRLQMADRFGNPTIGPSYEFDPGSLSYIGGQISMPIPVFNHRRGEIQQFRAQAAQAQSKVRQTEVEIGQDVSAAVQRLSEAQAWVKNYQQSVLPTMRKSMEDMQNQFNNGQPGVDVLRLLDVRRRWLRAQDGYLDALLIYTQALADLALAVGDPALAMGLYESPDLARNAHH